MLLPADRLINALVSEFAKLMPQISDAGTDGSLAQGIANALRLLANRENGGLDYLEGQLNGLEALLNEVGKLSGSSHSLTIAAMNARITALKAKTQFAAREAGWRILLDDGAALTTAIAADSSLASDIRKSISRSVVAWEARDRQAQVAPPDTSSTRPDTSISSDNLVAYLRDRFGEPGLEVTDFRQLAGGFGKETYLFEAKGKALDGAFVMRRDLAGGSSLSLGCHRVIKEYPVIKAAQARGFPAPDALWVDGTHTLLPGGDFIIMRQSPGLIGGNVFGAQTAIPDNLVDSLGDIMGRLHGLEPLAELGDLTEIIRADLWAQSRKDCTLNLITAWRDYFLANHHTPSPALMALFGWLFDNVPDRPGPAVMLHGDIAFNNFLFHEGQLNVVLDWEFAHIGDPAEELGYVRETVGNAFDWDRLMSRYIAAGGSPVDEAALRYYRIWAHVRNAAGSNLIAANFAAGLADDLKLAFLPHVHFPMFIKAAQALIDGG